MSPTAMSASSSTSTLRSRRRARPSSDQIKHALSLLDTAPPLLPPALPPSPPPSRPSSPAPPRTKRRRIEQSVPQQQNASASSSSAGTGSASTSTQPLLHPLPMRPIPVKKGASPAPPALQPAATKGSLTPRAGSAAPLESDKRRSSTPLSSGGPDVSAQAPPPPIVRPKRRMVSSEIKVLIEEYHNRALVLKRSGEARFNNKENKEPRTSRTTLIALLEITEGLLEFMYEFWLRDEIEPRRSQWATIHGLLNSCKQRWKENGMTGRGVGIVGLLNIVEGCVLSRETQKQYAALSQVLQPVVKSSSNNADPRQPHPSRPMLLNHPTPPGVFTPEQSPASTLSSASPSPPQNVPTLQDVWPLINKITFGQRRINEGHNQLSANVLSRLFPLTWERCGRSTLGVTDGHDVYPELCASSAGGDSGAAWFYPATSAEHLVHLVGMGKSLVWELARAELPGAPYLGWQGANTDY